jgi:hypothetical protein
MSELRCTAALPNPFPNLPTSHSWPPMCSAQPEPTMWAIPSNLPLWKHVIEMYSQVWHQRPLLAGLLVLPLGKPYRLQSISISLSPTATPSWHPNKPTGTDGLVFKYQGCVYTTGRLMLPWHLLVYILSGPPQTAVTLIESLPLCRQSKKCISVGPLCVRQHSRQQWTKLRSLYLNRTNNRNINKHTGC